MRIALIFLFVFLILVNHQAYSLTTNKLTVSYSNNYAPAYEIEIDSDKSFILSQGYSWVRDQSSRYNLIGYSIDDESFTQIDRKPRGNFTFDIPMDKPHSVVFFAVTQFPLVVKGLSDYEFNPKSPTGDDWFDSDANVQIDFPRVAQSSEDTKEVVVSWAVDNKEVHYANNETLGVISTYPLLMTDFHRVDFSSKIQYRLDVLSEYGTPYGGGWYDANSTVPVGIEAPHEFFARDFEGWQGASISSDKNPTMIIVDSPKILTAKWGYGNFFIIIFLIIGIPSLAFVIYHKKMSNQTRSKSPQIIEQPILDKKPAYDGTYSVGINKFIEEKVLETLQSYYTNGLIDEDKYQKIKNDLKANVFGTAG